MQQEKERDARFARSRERHFRLIPYRKVESGAILVVRARGVRAIRACDAIITARRGGTNNEHQHTDYADVGTGADRDAGRR